MGTRLLASMAIELFDGAGLFCAGDGGGGCGCGCDCCTNAGGGFYNVDTKPNINTRIRFITYARILLQLPCRP